MRFGIWKRAAAALGLASICVAAEAASPEPAIRVVQQLDVKATLAGPATVGDNTLKVTVLGPDGKPLPDAKITLTVAMTDMDMGTTHPLASRGEGAYTATVSFAMAGPWRVSVTVEAAGMAKTTKSFDFTVGAATPGMKMPGMKMDGMAMAGMMGRLGLWSMSREGSGTSWLPESSPMFMIMLPKSGAYDIDLMGFFTYNYTKSGGDRSDERFYSNSMPMLMARRDTGGGTLGYNLMLSFDPIFNGEEGYPDLFQTGETAHGQPLIDHQHPHDLLAEVTASYSHPLGGGVGAFVYGGPIGEPSLGGPSFMHRPSGFEIPEAPISHHWFDSTHISFGVVTAGLNSSQWQLEGSLFNGREPDENRYVPDPIGLNSASTRLTYNPSRNLSFNTSYGFLYSPERTDPGVDQHRQTAAAIWSLPVGHRDNLSLSALFGRNVIQGTDSDAYVLEGTYLRGPTSIFARWENVDKDELIGVPAGSYRINKFLFGAVQNVVNRAGLEFGIGAYAGLYSFPSSLDPYYGSFPVTLGVFVRLRPGRMK